MELMNQKSASVAGFHPVGGGGGGGGGGGQGGSSPPPPKFPGFPAMNLTLI